MITYEEVHRFFNYDKDTGEFKRIAFVRNDGTAYRRTSQIKSRHHSGYYITVVNGKRYRVHHLIFLYMTGKLPEGDVDHINGNRIDNRWVNLRVVTKAENQKNQGVRRDNTSGITGVYYYPPLNKYHAQITVDGKRIHLGYFSTKEEAIVVREKAKRRFGFHQNHGCRESWRG